MWHSLRFSLRLVWCFLSCSKSSFATLSIFFYERLIPIWKNWLKMSTRRFLLTKTSWLTVKKTFQNLIFSIKKVQAEFSIEIFGFFSCRFGLWNDVRSLLFSECFGRQPWTGYSRTDWRAKWFFHGFCRSIIYATSWIVQKGNWFGKSMF